MDKEKSEAHRVEIRCLFKELLAWVVYDREQHCLVEHRWDVDGRVADAYIDAHTDKYEYLISQTSAGISREAFKNRFYDFVVQCYVDMTNNRKQWLPDALYTL